jgi:release factor glutamine methyltransferase
MTSVGDALRTSGVERLDGQLLLLHAMGVPANERATGRAWLFAHGEADVPGEALTQFRQFVQRRADGEPLAYITRHKEFFGLDIGVDARVLVPRPDTELLVQWALDVLQRPEAAADAPPLAVLDLGTGSGAVALAIRHNRPEVLVDAVDASPQALQVAHANALALALDIGFLQGSWFAPVTSRYDCIVSNPPYIRDRDPHLAALRHEPRLALVSGADGLQDLREIICSAGNHLRPGGWLLVEHGYDQAAEVHALFDLAGFVAITCRRDLSGHERCTGGRVIRDNRQPLVK